MAFNPNKCLKFKALADGCRIALGESQVDHSHYQFSKDGETWQPDSITLNNGEFCYVKGTNWPSGYKDWMSYFTISAPAEIVSGNIMSLVDDGAGEQKTIPRYYAFQYLFRMCQNLKSIPRGLLPATTLAEACYTYMFYYCTGLTEIPEKLLPAKVLPNWCYYAIFASCHNIKVVPESLFVATSIGWFSYDEMFYYCIGLQEIHVPFTEWPDLSMWVAEVPSGGTFYCPAELPKIYDRDHIPPGWTVREPDRIYYRPQEVYGKKKEE